VELRCWEHRFFSIEGPMRWKQLLKPPPGDLWIGAAIWGALSLYVLWDIGTNQVPLLRGAMPSLPLLMLVLSLLATIGYWLAQKWVRLLVGTATILFGLYLLGDAVLRTGFTVWRVV